MTDSEDWWQPQNPQQGYGQQRPQEPPWQQDQQWQPRQYDPAAHQTRIQPRQRPPWPPQDQRWQQGQTWQQPGYGQPSYPPPPQYGQQPGWDQPPQQPYPPQQRPPSPHRRKSWPARHKALTWTAVGFVGLLVMGGIASATSGTPKAAAVPASPARASSATASPSASASVHTATPHASARASGTRASGTPTASSGKAEAACDSRGFASGDIYVRWRSTDSLDSGGDVPWTAQELGGEWGWDSATGQCLTSVQEQIAVGRATMADLPRGSTSCTQVGYVADNPGYNPDATPAGPLKDIAAETGNGC